jgi:hypothetical protein
MRLIPLLIQAVAVAVVVIGPRGRFRFDGLGTQVVIVAAVYHGLTEALQSAFPQANFYRDYLNDDDVDRWLWIVSTSLLAFACAYVASSRLRSRSIRPVATHAISLGKPWFWLVVTVPLYVYSVFGAHDIDAYWAGGLAEQFLLLSMVLTSVACVQAGASPVVMIGIQTAAASLLVSRLSVVATALMLLTGLYSAGERVRYRQVLYSGLLVVVVVLTISLARASVGREQLSQGVSDRAIGMMKGGALLASGGGGADLVDDFVYRFDGNTFPALIHMKFDRGHDPAGVWPFVNDVWVAVPAFVNPFKADADVTRRNDAAYIIAWFGLPENASFVPTQTGILYGSTGVILFPLAMLLCGALFERVDQRLGRLRSADGLIVKVALCQANAFMEMGFIVYPLALRGALVLIVLVRLIALSTHRKTLPRTGHQSIVVPEPQSRTLIRDDRASRAW